MGHARFSSPIFKECWIGFKSPCWNTQTEAYAIASRTHVMELRSDVTSRISGHIIRETKTGVTSVLEPAAGIETKNVCLSETPS
jgi:hypothetical protein